MKKIFASFLSFVVPILFLLTTVPSYASNSSNPTLSDAVYADLAVRGFLDNVGIEFYDGNKRDTIGINETRHFLPASTVKLFAAMYAFKLIGDSRLHLYDTIQVDGKNVVPTELVTSELPTIQEGEFITIDRLIRQMITQSDNTAFNIMLDILDRRAINDYIHSLGLTHSAIGSKLNLDTTQSQYEFDVPGYGINTTTAEDYTNAFVLIWKNKIPGARPLLEILKQQKIKYMLPLLLPKNVIVADKTGDLAPLFHDGGLILGPKGSYILSVFTNAGDPNLIAHLSQLIYTKDYSLVGAPLQNIQKNLSEQNPPLDPLVAQGMPIHQQVLAARTDAIQTQPITAADLGITAKDLSLTQSSLALPRVIIPVDSPLHFFVPAWQFFKKYVILPPQARPQVDIDIMRLQVSEARDLLSRGKVQQANTVLQAMQQNMNAVVGRQTIKTNGETQTTIQSISETRFQVLDDALRSSEGSKRDALIKEIGEQARVMVSKVQPEIPLATNATNPTQNPLVGQVVDKTDTTVIVKTAGGQQITIPLTNESLAIKTREVILPTPTPTVEENVPTLHPSPEQKPSLKSIAIGTTVAMVGSYVANTFTPTFLLTNVPKELVAPEPVVVVKINKKDHTMVIAENGVPVQVNVSNQTAIRGTDTGVSFDAIKPGDVIIVHGKPLTPIVPPNTSTPPAPAPSSSTPLTKQQFIPLQSSVNTTVQPSVGPSPLLSLSPTRHNAKTSPVPLQSVFNPVQTSPTSVITQTSKNNSSISPQAGVTMTQKQNTKTTNAPVVTSAQTTSSPKTTQQPSVHQTETSSNGSSSQQTSQQQKTQSQPKVIQSTSIQIIEKKEDAGKPAPAPAQQTSQPKPEQKQNTNTGQKSQPAQQPATQPQPTTKDSGKKK